MDENTPIEAWSGIHPSAKLGIFIGYSRVQYVILVFLLSTEANLNQKVNWGYLLVIYHKQRVIEFTTCQKCI